MSNDRLPARYAAARSAARLGRPPQDPLELAVVLEAWAGVRPPVALATASQVSFAPGRPSPSVGGTRSRRWTRAVAGVCLAALSVLWVGRIEESLAPQPLGPTMFVALPIGLACVAAFHRRYLIAELGLGVMRSHPWAAARLAALGALGSVVIGGLVAGAVVAVVVATALVAERWPVAAVAAVGVPLAAVGLGASAVAAGAWAVSASTAAAVVACRTVRPVTRPPVPVVRVIGPVASMAVFAVLVLSAVQRPLDSWSSVGVLLPTVVGLTVAAMVADRMWVAVPDRLRAEPVSPHVSPAARRATLGVLLRSVLAYLVVWGAGSFALGAFVAVPAVELGAVGSIGLASTLAESAGLNALSSMVVMGGLACQLWIGPAAVWLLGTVAIAAALALLAVDVDRSFAVRW